MIPLPLIGDEDGSSFVSAIVLDVGVVSLMVKRFLAGLAAAGVAICALGADAARGKKLIVYGWDVSKAGPEEILANADRFDALGIDGVFTSLRGNTPEGKPYSHATLMNGPRISSAMVAPQVETLKRYAEHEGLRHSFLICWISPKMRLAWTDDAAWRLFAENMRVVADAARKGGMEGLFLDNEDYSRVQQYRLKDSDGLTYAEAAALARRRGAEVFGEVFRAHPDVALMAAWFFSWNDHYAYVDNPVREAERSRDLWPSFLNGILDVIPPGAKFVEGDERGYLCSAEKRDFHVRAVQHRVSGNALTAPENRAKYALQGQTAFGLFLDAYTPEVETGDYCRTFPPAADGSMSTRFMQNLAAAAQVASEYVWIYGQAYCWVDWARTPDSKVWSDRRYSVPLQSGGIWTNRISRLADALAAERSPQGMVGALLAKTQASGSAKELVDGDAAAWKVSGKALERRSISVPVTAGGLYAVNVSAEVKESALEVMIFWENGGRREHLVDAVYMPLRQKGGDMQEDLIAVRAPCGVDGMEIRTSVWQKPSGAVDVSRISVVRIL